MKLQLGLYAFLLVLELLPCLYAFVVAFLNRCEKSSSFRVVLLVERSECCVSQDEVIGSHD